MIKRIPIVATPIPINEGLGSVRALENFKSGLLKFTGRRYAFLLNSATSCVFVALRALNNISGVKKVILPAYTASSLVIAVKKAGLTPALVDISLKDFQIDLKAAGEAQGDDISCVICPHMFGITVKGMGEFKQKFPKALVIEDCAQALGGIVDGKPVGSSGDISVLSFNRGKNMPTYSGGCALTDDKGLAADMEKQLSDIEDEDQAFESLLPLRIFALSVLVRPRFYALAYPFLAGLKDRKPADDFKVKKYTSRAAVTGSSLLRRIGALSRKRYENGLRLIEGLRGAPGLILPEISAGSKPAFNRFPLVFEDLNRKKKAVRGLSRAGIESSEMYLEPLHHLFGLGYEKFDFPNSVYLARHLLTLPVHPYVDVAAIEKMIKIIR